MPAQKRKLKKRGERWRYLGSFNGIKYCSKSVYLTKKQAQDAEREYLRDLQNKIINIRTDMKLLDLVNDRLDFIKDTKSLDYYKENKRYMKKLIDFLGTDIMVSRIRKKDIIDLVELEAKRLKKANRGYFKVNSMIRLLKALFFYGIRRKELDIKNPVIGIEMYSIDQNAKYIPPQSQIDFVREVLSPRQRLLFDFVSESGCRINEAVRLSYDHIRDDKVILYTRKAKNSNLTARIVPLPPCLNGITGKGKVFYEWDDYPRFLEQAVKLCEFPTKWNWHNLRHRYASKLATEGRPLIEIMNLLGHTNLATTQRYLQFLGHNFF